MINLTTSKLIWVHQKTPFRGVPVWLTTKDTIYLFIYLNFFFFFFGLFAISWAAPTAYGGSQARGPIGAVATGLHQSHSNTGSEPHLQPTPQLTATPDH